MVILTSPAPGRSTGSPFGWRTDPISGKRTHHNGVDFPGTFYVVTAAPGRVVSAGFDALLGYYVTIEHDATTRTQYAHGKALSKLQVGDQVDRGALVFVSGSTGYSTGPHLHFALYRRTLGVWRRVDPIPQLSTISTTYRKATIMPILVPLVKGAPPQLSGDYAIIGDGGIVGLQAKEDAALIDIAKRAMLDREPIYGNQGDQLQALFARVALKPAAVDYGRLAAEIAKQMPASSASDIVDIIAARLNA